MNELCEEHKNKIQRICLNVECQNRALCLLCDHPHGNPFQSIMVKTSQNYKTFEQIINKAIDSYLLEKEESTENQVLQEQTALVRKYFADLKAEFANFLAIMETETISKLQSEEANMFKTIKRARINKNYVDLPKKIFKVLRQIYEGTQFQEMFKNNQSGNTEQAYHFSLKLHQKLKQLMEERDTRLRVKLPDIRQVMLREQRDRVIENETVYDFEMAKPKYEVKLLKQSTIEYDSIISDCIKMDKYFMSTSYDKNLRIVDEKLQLRAEKQYSNILTKVFPIAEDVYAIGQSKQLLIQNIKFEKGELAVQNIMKLRGHTEKINDISSLNSRIIGSSSSQGVKIWDLYKERCEFTLKDEANPTVIDFIAASNTLMVGYNSHIIKLYSVETMKLIKKYQLPGVPLLIDRGKFTQNLFYVGGFPSFLAIVDTRFSKLGSQFNLNQGAISCLADSIYDDAIVATGDRDGNCNLFDLRTKRSRISWMAHEPHTSISKPRGVVNIFEKSQVEWITVGCNQKSFKTWNVQNVLKEH